MNSASESSARLGVPWTLPSPPDTATAVHKAAWDGEDVLHRVYWHPDGIWQFMGYHFSGAADEIVTVCLEDAFVRWPHVGALATLAPGEEGIWSFDQFGWYVESVGDMG